MNGLRVSPGDVVVTNFEFYQHWSVVTDRKCKDGHYMLISATSRTGTVHEEPWSEVTQGNKTYVVNLDSSNMNLSKLLVLARSQIAVWKYSLFNSNCEHFVKWVYGLGMISLQLTAGNAGLFVGVILAFFFTWDIHILNLFMSSVVTGPLFIFSVKVPERSLETSFAMS